ncbi:MAG: hypothetical protein AABZ64_04995 [Nitrospinota bacterium]
MAAIASSTAQKRMKSKSLLSTMGLGFSALAGLRAAHDKAILLTALFGAAEAECSGGNRVEAGDEGHALI